MSNSFVNVGDDQIMPATAVHGSSAVYAQTGTIAAQSPAGAVQPVAWMWQHDETGMTGFVEHASPEDLAQWERMNRPRKIVSPLFAAPAEVLEVLEKARQALAKCLQWMDNHGEVVFFGGGMGAVDPMNAANKDARAALAEIEASGPVRY